MGGRLVLVAGAGGFIGGHLVSTLLGRGVSRIRAVDIKPLDEWYQVFPDVENLQLDLCDRQSCLLVCEGVADVYQLAADMGGMGFIEANKAACMLSVLITTQMLMAARERGVERFFYTSSACVYNADKQSSEDLAALKEQDAYPATPEDGYGWEKLFSERMCRHFTEDYGILTRVVRLHNVYGPHGTWDGGREKAPAAISRKVAAAVIDGTNEIEIWGDGTRTRSFMCIDDCITGISKIMDSAVDEPINLGSSERVTINQLVDTVEEIAGVNLERRYILDAPTGVAGRSSDNTMIRERLGWEPETSLRDGLEVTYRWVYEQCQRRAAGKKVVV